MKTGALKTGAPPLCMSALHARDRLIVSLPLKRFASLARFSRAACRRLCGGCCPCGWLSLPLPPPTPPVVPAVRPRASAGWGKEFSVVFCDGGCPSSLSVPTNRRWVAGNKRSLCGFADLICPLLRCRRIEISSPAPPPSRVCGPVAHCTHCSHPSHPLAQQQQQQRGHSAHCGRRTAARR